MKQFDVQTSGTVKMHKAWAGVIEVITIMQRSHHSDCSNHKEFKGSNQNHTSHDSSIKA